MAIGNCRWIEWDEDELEIWFDTSDLNCSPSRYKDFVIELHELRKLVQYPEIIKMMIEIDDVYEDGEDNWIEPFNNGNYRRFDEEYHNFILCESRQKFPMVFQLIEEYYTTLDSLDVRTAVRERLDEISTSTVDADGVQILNGDAVFYIDKDAICVARVLGYTYSDDQFDTDKGSFRGDQLYHNKSSAAKIILESIDDRIDSSERALANLRKIRDEMASLI